MLDRMPQAMQGTAAERRAALVAKTDAVDERLWLPLTIHLQDIASVMRYLVEEWLPERYHESLGLSREDFMALATAAAMFHDIGKSTKLFQWRITERRPELRERLLDLGLETEFQQLRVDIRLPHGAAGAELLRLEGFGSSLAAVVGAHHGTPESWTDVEDQPLWRVSPRSFGWESSKDRSGPWDAVQKDLIRWAMEQQGLESPGALSECSITAQMALTGLVIMADWIASNTAYFPLIPMEGLPGEAPSERAERALGKLRLPKPWSVSEDWKSEDYFEGRFGFAANAVQKEMERAAAEMEAPGVMILEAPMGQGKTEAALAAAEILMQRFHLGGAAFFLPSQATSNAMFHRMIQWAKHQPDAVRIAVELVHGQAGLNAEFEALEEGRAQVGQGEADEESLTVHSFFQGRKTGLLADLVVGTVDQLLMAGLKQRHVMLRHLGLTGKVVIIDECHAYDAYMNIYLDRVLDWLGAYKIPVILLSATLPGKRRAGLLRAYSGQRKAKKRQTEEAETSQAYPLLSWMVDGTVHMDPIPDGGERRSVAVRRVEEDVAAEAAGRALEQGCVGMIVNTVKRAQALRDIMAERYPEAVVLLDHSRFLAQDRLEHEEEILDRVGKRSTQEKRKGVLVIGTQVLEQSLDLDFDLLITDLCPMELLLQRIGRLHRHPRLRPQGLEEARCLVMGAQDTLERGSSAVYGDYLLLRTRALLPETIRLPEDISPLVQKTYDETWSPEDSPEYGAAEETYRLEQGKKQQRAKGCLLPRPVRGIDPDGIVGLMDDAPGLTDPQARAAVRDGDSAIEVLVVRRTEDGDLELLSGAEKGTRYRADSQPSREEAKAIAAQRLRLPAYFGKQYRAEEVIRELERRTWCLPLWTQAPMLTGELFLVLEADGTVELTGEKLCYDPLVGLREVEGEHGADRIQFA
ncbi:CRISPR-associated helicase Cas3' [Pseudoflavonifractor sp. MSJ-37]|uniref:CRISPR-associated helicase Cas3' n=1 Tax=Pseudoflavonifractor sp. MSJ-37 TaxID=2841531 RepID=UPI001C1011D8|nr:CRISPR-associated helicase Cas3' [Pseudoflavonifractor sp. MSJ-37]MBU5434212.1 CRISPR-associated helicase Cas3' [Pseudoflavonifractor sp. MSJ-37]